MNRDQERRFLVRDFIFEYGIIIGAISGIAILLIIPLSIPVLGLIRSNWDIKEHTIEVHHAERVNKRDSSYYLVYTEDETYSVTDSFWWWSWDASDRYSILVKKGKFKVTTYGWRWPFFSSYKNIIKAEPVEEVLLE